MTTKEEALRQALEALEQQFPVGTAQDYLDGESAKELRRLHEVNQELLEALEELCACPQWVDEATVPKAGVEANPTQVVMNMSVGLVRLRKARAAIAKATGEQA